MKLIVVFGTLNNNSVRPVSLESYVQKWLNAILVILLG